METSSSDKRHEGLCTYGEPIGKNLWNGFILWNGPLNPSLNPYFKEISGFQNQV